MIRVVAALLIAAFPFGAAYAGDADFFSVKCPSLTLDKIRSEFATRVPFGKDLGTWTSPDYSELDTRYGTCLRLTRVDASREVIALENFMLPYQRAAEERARASERPNDTRPQEERIALTMRYSEAEMAQEQRESDAAVQQNKEAHDPAFVLARYLANTPLAGDQALASPGDEYFTSVDLGWVYNGNPAGPQAHCTLTMAFHTPGLNAENAPPFALGSAHVERASAPAGALVLYWNRKGPILVITKAGWHLPDGVRVETKLSYYRPEAPKPLDSRVAALPGMGRFAAQMNGIAQGVMKDVTRQATELDPSFKPETDTIAASFASIAGLLVHRVSNLQELVTMLPSLGRIDYVSGNEPSWIPTGAGAEAMSHFAACVSQGTAVVAAPPSTDTKPY